MKRRTIHLAFASAAAALAVLAAFQATHWRQADRLADALARPTADALPPSPESAMLEAMSRAAAGDYDGALLAYKALIVDRTGPLRRTALFNLGNLHLREALRRRQRSADEALPYLELAKESYRDLLRLDAGDWDARYNLERALWLAPEEARTEMEAAAPVPSERAITTMRGGKGALP
ncbi:MAG: MxaK protein [Zoogloeaceae bacterium]|nr:hypothetical protein [Rhodocyclaceae bacterium]MCP5234365.1 MxaK protein [Zoogloeaceae bacterium]